MGDLLKATADLEEACAAVRKAGVLALDTEFVWTRTYRPQLGIVQMGCGEDACWALDCCCGMNPSALKDLIEDASVVKILHDARQDLSHLRHYACAVPRNVFDTQLAAAFAGFPAGYGLQKLLFETIDVGLAKTETMTDWLQRPLSEAQVRYALDDVRYLPALCAELLKRAEAFGTRAWLEEELRRYETLALYEEHAPDEVWKRIKLNRVQLDGRGRAILRAVAARRETQAQTWNLPKAWLGDDTSLIDMAVSGAVRHLRHRLRGGQGDTIRSLYAEEIRKAAALPEEEWPEDTVVRYIPEVVAASKEAQSWLAEKAETLHVAPGVIANKATVTAFVDDVGDETNPLATGWRYEAVGREMAERFGVD